MRSMPATSDRLKANSSFGKSVAAREGTCSAGTRYATTPLAESPISAMEIAATVLKD